MNKIFCFSILICILTSCSNPIEKSLKDNVKNSNKELAHSYKLESYEILDTVTVSKRIKILQEELSQLNLPTNIDSIKFREMRNQEFKEFRSNTEYEDEIMFGKYKDASEWCTELRVATEMADSLLANWANAKDSWEAKRLYMFYTTRWLQFYGGDEYSEEWRQEVLKEFDSYKPIYDELSYIINSPKDSVLYINLYHTYSFKDPILDKRVIQKDSITMDMNYNILSRETVSDFIDIIKQLLDN